jgi:hypothetical protein
MVSDLPRHLYVHVDSAFTHVEPCGFIPAVWFGLVSVPGRVWGCTVLLESGAIYRNLPPHALAFHDAPEQRWMARQSQVWNCYGTQFVAHEYRYLAGLSVIVNDLGEMRAGTYLFSACPMSDGFSAEPEQAKEFSFIRLENGRLTIQPTNNLMFIEGSFTKPRGSIVFATDFPAGLRRQTESWSCE